jgi:hypothetical protein
MINNPTVIRFRDLIGNYPGWREAFMQATFVCVLHLVRGHCSTSSNVLGLPRLHQGLLIQLMLCVYNQFCFPGCVPWSLQRSHPTSLTATRQHVWRGQTRQLPKGLMHVGLIALKVCQPMPFILCCM